MPTFTIDDAAPAPASKFTIGDDTTHAVAAARVAQPTQFEKDRADASNTPWKDTAKGFGEGALKTVSNVSGLINKIPYVGETLAPSQGVNAATQIATPRTAGEHLGSNIESVGEAALPVGEAIDAVKGTKLVRPAAQFATEHVIPWMAKSIPYFGKAVEASASAPTALRAIGSGAAKGAAIGGVEEGWRTKDPVAAAKGAIAGGVTGGVAGGGAYGLSKLARPAAAEIPNIVSKDPFTLTSPEVEREAAIQQPMEFPTVTPATPAAPVAGPQPGRTGPPLKRLGDLIQQGAGTPAMPTLQPDVPIGQQPRSVGAASEGFPRVGEPLMNAGGKVTFRREPIIKTVGGLEEGPLRNVAPEKVPAALGNEVERAAGGTPDVTAAEKQRLQTKYPDRETRQLVHANGEAIIDATANDRETMKAIHDLKNPDVRQAAINLGESMVRDDGSPIMVNNRMLSGDVTRQQMFEKLLKKGYSPKEIVAAAHRDMEEGGAAGRPGLMRSQPWTTPGEKTGD